MITFNEVFPGKKTNTHFQLDLIYSPVWPAACSSSARVSSPGVPSPCGPPEAAAGEPAERERGGTTEREGKASGRARERRTKGRGGLLGRFAALPVVCRVSPSHFFFSPVSFSATKVQRLQGRCEQQERQLRALKGELRKTSLGLEAFIITTQHYSLKVTSWNNAMHTVRKMTVVSHSNNDILHFSMCPNSPHRDFVPAAPPQIKLSCSNGSFITLCRFTTPPPAFRPVETHALMRVNSRTHSI